MPISLASLAKLSRLAAVLAVLACPPAEPAAAAEGDVVLRLKGGTYQLSGRLVSNDGARIVIDVAMLGVMTVDAARFDCIGSACKSHLPTEAALRIARPASSAGQAAEQFAIHGSSTMGAELLPGLIKAFAESRGATAVQLVGAEANESKFRIVGPAGVEQGSIAIVSYRPTIHLTCGIQGYAHSVARRPVSSARRLHARDAASTIAS